MTATILYQLWTAEDVLFVNDKGGDVERGIPPRHLLLYSSPTGYTVIISNEQKSMDTLDSFQLIKAHV